MRSSATSTQMPMQWAKVESIYKYELNDDLIIKPINIVAHSIRQ